MANKIVLIKKGLREGVEFPLDVDTGTNGRSLCHDGDDSFWVLLTGNPVHVKKYRIDRGANQAVFTGVDLSVTATQGTGVCTDGASLYVSTWNVRGSTTTKNILKVDRRGGKEIARFTYSSETGLTLATSALDLSFDGEKVWYGFVTGVVGADNRMRSQQVSKWPSAEPTHNLNSGNAAHRGIAFDKGGQGFWWADTDGGNNYKLVSASGFIVRDTVPLTHAGTLRGMDDTGPLLAFMFN